MDEHHCATPKVWQATIRKVVKRRLGKTGRPCAGFLLFLISKNLYEQKQADGTLVPCPEHPGFILAQKGR